MFLIQFNRTKILREFFPEANPIDEKPLKVSAQLVCERGKDTNICRSFSNSSIKFVSFLRIFAICRNPHCEPGIKIKCISLPFDFSQLYILN